MIMKTLFLVKKIHRIGTQNLHDKKSLLENIVGYRALRAIRSGRADGDTTWADTA
jgi:hypothetical protein